MDGARLWNAAVASGTDPARIVRDLDSVSVCFSKGLGAPVGSAVAGGEDVIELVRRNRKLFGGGMRQAGIIAAGALYALRHHVDRLADDHRNARALAEGLAGCRRMRTDPGQVETNIVFGRIGDGTPPSRLLEEMAAVGVLCATTWTTATSVSSPIWTPIPRRFRARWSSCRRCYDDRMKTDIHPEYVVARVHCSCGNEFLTRSTKPELSVEICSECHPFYTGKQKLVDTGGRVERFRRRQARSSS